MNEIYLKIYASVQATKGITRLLVVDYAHDFVYYLPLEYYDIFELLKHKSINSIQDSLDDKVSRDNFDSFINFVIDNRLGFKTETPESFPDISEDLFGDNKEIFDSIIEIGNESNLKDIFSFCTQIAELGCQEIEIWIVSECVSTMILQALCNQLTVLGFSYIAIHLPYCPDYGTTELLLRTLIENTPALKKVYAYNAPINKRIDVVKQSPNIPSVSLGELFFIKKNFEGGKECGKINFTSLDFSGHWVCNQLKKFNGCLYKKISLNRNGYLMNCPLMEHDYGHISKHSVKEISNDETFKFWGKINKDQISECKVCEYRYNCCDCRAIRKSKDIYSKPLKCSYNPNLNIWE